MVVGSNVRIQWWEGWPMDGFQRMGWQWVGGLAVVVGGLTVGGLAVAVGGCVGCGGSVVGCVFCFCFCFSVLVVVIRVVVG